MKNTIAMIGMFVLGAAAGVASTMIYVDKKYTKKSVAEKEINSARETYTKLNEELREEKKRLMDLNNSQKERIWDDYKKGISSFGYVDEVMNKKDNSEAGDINAEATKEEPTVVQYQPSIKKEKDTDIYFVTEEDAGKNEYNEVSLIYYSNGIITDNIGDVVENPEAILGETILDLLPTYDDGGFTDTYVRNDLNKTDYFIEMAGVDFFES